MPYLYRLDSYVSIIYKNDFKVKVKKKSEIDTKS